MGGPGIEADAFGVGDSVGPPFLSRGPSKFVSCFAEILRCCR